MPSSDHPSSPPFGADDDAAHSAAFDTGTTDMGKQAFLRMASHELRTPLNSIIGFAEVLKNELHGPLGAPEYLEYAGIIRDSGTQLLGLFNNVLEIVRLESEPDLLRPSADAVLSHIDDSLEKHEARARANEVRLELVTSDSDPVALFHPRGLSTCLDHLLLNAIDYTPAGQVIRIEVSEGEKWVDILVRNPGPAPLPDDLPRLMKPFEQGATAHNRTRHGAGLGWAIVRLTCQNMGGRFYVKSQPEVGLTAILRLQKPA
ncbi:sensor histidine kinase [Asticcacaulis tiandongensis]|uniref:sensor histidine kinase n=1 Tax=Asticcacaulis tiandongensis TaxID=2565365 RepID=UPI00112B7668|nr:HAMP domain-containing sensor histidine kinase [Asticcacaulis tiandongensis]